MAAAKKKSIHKVVQSAITGRLVSKKYANKHLKATVVEVVKKKKK